MRKIRIYCEHKICEGRTVELSEYNANHLAKVLRKKTGDSIHLFNEANGEWECEISFIDKKNVTVSPKKFIGKNNIDTQIDLYFSPVKNPDATWIAQKATELGAKNIYPFIAERSVVKSINMQKLKASVNDATQQSERTDLLKIHNVISFRDLQKIDYDHVLFFDESGKGKKPNKLASINPSGKVAIIIGNEGGFTEHERE